MPDIETYTETAIEHAAIALLWQAPDATEDGNGFPIGDDANGQLHGETQYVARIVEEVPYITEAVTAFVRDNWALLQRGEVTAEQCGHDIILTANRHGAGFWDRGYDMPAADDEAYTAWKTIHDRMPYPRSRKLWEFWLAKRRPYPGQYPQTVGDALTEATRGYSFDAEFALDDDGDVAWLMVENTVLVDELGWASEPGTDDVADAAQLSRTESSACDG
jgi:hypothetical protein